ncbi:hypothetical protein [Hydrogenobaculum phage 1]|uniref:hypothetical protein n=1 Tax=Hydrogenobaculum phage 1 TaxID=1732176 RepID=UPI000706AF48|nr:hypothetical protein AUR69_gp08 [Hydrogenobaculum phage 1]ALG96919.1 hypothetical protein [Hydrogenobaculum phage 1]
MSKKWKIGNQFLHAFHDVVYTAITLIFIEHVKNKRTFEEVWQTIMREFDINIVDFKDLKEVLKAEATFFRKLKTKYAKMFIPPSLQDLACEVRMLYLYLLLKFPKEKARMWAVLYGLVQPAFLNNPLPVALLTLTDALCIRGVKRYFTKENLEKAFERLKTKGILRGEKMTFNELLSHFEVEEENIVDNYFLYRYEKAKKEQELKNKKIKTVLI